MMSAPGESALLKSGASHISLRLSWAQAASASERVACATDRKMEPLGGQVAETARSSNSKRQRSNSCRRRHTMCACDRKEGRAKQQVEGAQMERTQVRWRTAISTFTVVSGSFRNAGCMRS
jgi:hypothetical protein